LAKAKIKFGMRVRPVKVPSALLSEKTNKKTRMKTGPKMPRIVKMRFLL
jgi:hypothetical protein